MIYNVLYTKKAIEDIQNLKAAGIATKAEGLCKSLAVNSRPLNSKQLNGDLKGKRSIRINLQHRLVYEILKEEKVIKILSMWGHY
jgi:Txe/YoeB family toxin of toxin-antitoxin system